MDRVIHGFHEWNVPLNRMILRKIQMVSHFDWLLAQMFQSSPLFHAPKFQYNTQKIEDQL